MINSIIEMFNYEFMIRAFIVGILLSISSSLIGTSLVLRHNSMIGDGLSHVGFGTFAVATVLGIPTLKFSIPIVIIISFLILKVNDNKKISGDSLIAIISTASLAFGTFVISIKKGINTDINNYLFGSILSITKEDVVLSIVIITFVILLFIFSYNKIFAITFDEKFAKSIGINTNFYNIIFSVLCSIIVVIGMKLIGSLLISSLIVFPTISSKQIFKKYKSVVLSSIIISVLTFIIGLTFSYYHEIPTGSTIVIVNVILLLILKIIARFIKKQTT